MLLGYAKTILIILSLAAFIGSNIYTFMKTRIVTSRNLTQHYEKELSKLELQSKEAVLDAQREHVRELQEADEIIRGLKPANNNSDERRMCESDPYCEKSRGSS